MNYFQPVFGAAMILMPLVQTLFFRPRAADIASGLIDPTRIRKRRLHLVLGTAAALVLGGLVLFFVERQFESSRLVPVWILFFPLWFRLAMPLVRELRPDETPH